MVVPPPNDKGCIVDFEGISPRFVRKPATKDAPYCVEDANDGQEESTLFTPYAMFAGKVRHVYERDKETCKENV